LRSLEFLHQIKIISEMICNVSVGKLNPTLPTDLTRLWMGCTISGFDVDDTKSH